MHHLKNIFTRNRLLLSIFTNLKSHLSTTAFHINIHDVYLKFQTYYRPVNIPEIYAILDVFVIKIYFH